MFRTGQAVLGGLSATVKGSVPARLEVIGQGLSYFCSVTRPVVEAVSRM